MATITFEDGTKVDFDGNPTPQDVEEVASQLKSKNQNPSSAFGMAAKIAGSEMPFLPPVMQMALHPDQAVSVGRGILNGASFQQTGNVQNEQNPNARKIGQLLGMGIPLTAAAMTGGAAMGIGATAMGTGALGASVAEGLGTGAMFEGIKGAATGRNPLDTLSEAGKTGSTFAGFNVAGAGLGYLRKVFGENMAESIANHFINTDKKIAEKLTEQGKPSLGKQYLETDMPGFKNREEVYTKAGDALVQTERRIGGRLEANKEMLKTPIHPSAPSKETLQLPYNPSGTSYQLENPSMPEGTRYLPRVPMYRDPIAVGTIPSPTDPGEAGFLTSGGRDAGRFVKGGGKGEFLPQSQEELEAESLKARELHRFAANQYGLKDIPDQGFATREGVVQTSDIASSLDDISSKFQTGTHRGEVSKIDRLKQSFMQDNPKNLTLQEAVGLKRKLDERVSKAYLATEGSKVPAATEVDEALANALRKRIYEIDPKLGELAAQESLMIRIRAGLLPEVAKRGGSRLPSGLYSTIVNAIEGSPVANLAAKGLKSTLGKPSQVIAPITKQGMRAIQFLPDENQ